MLMEYVIGRTNTIGIISDGAALPERLLTYNTINTKISVYY